MTNNILGLPPLKTGFENEINPLGANVNSKLVPKGDIREINQDTILRQVIIDAYAQKSEYAVKRLTDMDQKTFADFYISMQTIFEINKEAEGKPYQEYSDAFTKRLLQVMARHIFAYLEASAESIAYEIHRPPSSDNSPRTFLQQIFNK